MKPSVKDGNNLCAKGSSLGSQRWTTVASRMSSREFPRPLGLCLTFVLLTGALTGTAVRAGFLEADAEAAHTRNRHILSAIVLALAPLGSNGTFEPTHPDFYAAKQDAINTAFRVNETFFANLNQTDVPPVAKISNGTFEIKPVVAAGGSHIEDANTDGECCNGLPTRS